MHPTLTEEAVPTIVVETERAPSPENAAVAEAKKSASADASEKPESAGEADPSELKKLRKAATKYEKLQQKLKSITKEKVDADKDAVEAVKAHNETLQKRLDHLEAEHRGQHCVVCHY